RRGHRSRAVAGPVFRPVAADKYSRPDGEIATGERNAAGRAARYDRRRHAGYGKGCREVGGGHESAHGRPRLTSDVHIAVRIDGQSYYLIVACASQIGAV